MNKLLLTQNDIFQFNLKPQGKKEKINLKYYYKTNIHWRAKFLGS